MAQILFFLLSTASSPIIKVQVNLEQCGGRSTDQLPLPHGYQNPQMRNASPLYKMVSTNSQLQIKNIVFNLWLVRSKETWRYGGSTVYLLENKQTNPIYKWTNAVQSYVTQGSTVYALYYLVHIGWELNLRYICSSEHRHTNNYID